MALTLTISTAAHGTRLGAIYTLQELVDEVQVISGQLDPELVPRKSIEKHIDIATMEVAALLNNYCAPWYGETIDLTISGTGVNSVALTDKINVAYNSTPTYASVGIDKVVAVTLAVDPGTTKRARDWSQFSGIAYGGNAQWNKSVAWYHHGQNLWVYVGSSLTLSAASIQAYRNPAPLSTGSFTGVTTDKLDLPDKYAPLVVAKAALWAMKQSKMGNWQEVAGEVNAGIQSIAAEFQKNMEMATVKPQLEAIQM